jgi:Mrp family chromosome partitioning ATPase
MTDDPPLRRRRPRLDPGERTRLLEEIARIDAATRGTAKPAGAKAARTPNLLPRVTEVWGNLLTIPIDPDLLDRNLIITASRANPAHGAFDVLRTRMLQALAEHGWKRVGITSPTQGCGKSFTAINLAVTLSRYDNCRTVLMDMDLRHPAIARTLGAPNPPAMGDYLRGLIPTEAFLRKAGQNMLNIGSNMAVGLNGRTEGYAAELFHDPMATEVLARMDQDVRPDVVLFDLPPALAQDDVIAFRPHFDCLLLVAGGGMTTAKQMQETVRRIGEDKPVIGVVLNKAEGEDIHDYSY